MIVIIPLGGIGSRYKKNGYTLPKALINVFGKPIIFWLLDTLTIDKDTLVYIPYNKEYLKFRFKDKLVKKYPDINFKFFVLENTTRGAAETLNIALKKLDCIDQPIISLDSDNFYLEDILSLWNKENTVLTFNDSSQKPLYSYVKTNENNIITKIIEKEKISDNACCGGYGFSSYKELIHYTDYIINNNIRQKEEFYTSTVISEMIKNNIEFTNLEINKSSYICLGTPLQLKYFYNNYPKKSCLTFYNNLPELRICFDLDNTLVSFPKKAGDYTSVEPITENIEFLRYLKSFNHTIIIYTARRMKTHYGNTGKLLADIGKITFDTLDKFNIPYDEIYFGKPQADFYIDDLAVNCFDNLEKNLGFYQDTIKPRDFNEINENFIEIYKKKSKDLAGEIFYYQNIPKKIKDMFPIFLNYCDNNSWYEIEKISGLTASLLYTSELLTSKSLISIMDSIRRIHNVKNNDVSNINIYENYSNKLKKRYANYDYSVFLKSNEIYENLVDFLNNYETNKKGKKCVIHGDTVLTNIIINEHGKIKFIDMRGKIGDTLTIFGDWLYDWAKLYQSLIGYDAILLNKKINDEYKKKMISVFSNYFKELFSDKDFDNLKMITKSLLFTLIPLHNNEKCKDYFKLINSEYLN